MVVNHAVPIAEFQGSSIVAFGSFNPPIFQPLWLSKNSLIREEEAENAKIEVIHNEVAQFKTEWFSLLVTKDRFALESTDPTKDLPVRDLALGIFKVLEHTPLHGFVFTRHQHFSLGSEKRWHYIGDLLAPKGPWNAIFPDAGLQTLIIMDQRGYEKARDYTSIRVEPSAKVQYGVYIQVNEHRKPNVEKLSDRMAEFISSLESSWLTFITACDGYSAHVLKLAMEDS